MSYRPLPSRLDVGLASVLCGAASLILYVFTLAPTFGWGDSADLALRMVDPADTTFVGSSRDYALYRAVGSVFQGLPIGDAGTRANLMTAVFGATSVGLVAWLAGIITTHPAAALAAGVSLAVAHSFWLLSVTAEVYTFNIALVMGAYTAFALWWRGRHWLHLSLMGLCAGLALNHHATGLILAGSLVPLLAWRAQRRDLLSTIPSSALFVAAAWPFWQGAWDRLTRGASWSGALGIGLPTNLLHDAQPAAEAGKLLAYTGYNFFGLGCVLAMLGAFACFKRGPSPVLVPPLLWAAVLASAGVASSIPDKHNIYILVYPAVSLMVGLGLSHVCDRRRFTRRTMTALLVTLCVLPPSVYYATAKGASRMGLNLAGARSAPYRDNDWYFLWPSKRGDDGPRRYANEALAQVAPDAVLIADYTLWRTLVFMQRVEGQRRDVDLVFVEPLFREGVEAFIDNVACDRPVYLATDTPRHYYQLDRIEARFGIQPEGLVFRVTDRCRTPSASARGL